MSPVPQSPAGGSRQQRAAQLKAETEAKQAQALAAEAGGPQPGQEYTLQEEDTLESIARQVEQEPETIWNHENNAELRERRGTPEKLEAGDTIFIPEDEKGKGPVGQGDYVVKEGDSIESIAFEKGYFWETVWEHPDNAELKEVRKDPNVLLPGDRVTIPEKTPKQESGETEMRHRFLRKGIPATFALQVFDRDEPWANQPYTLTVDDLVFTGVTDPDGLLRHPVPPNAKKGRLTIGPDEAVFDLDFGAVDPITEPKGIQQRLNNLGFHCGPPDGHIGEDTRAALRAFQERAGLPVTGERDEATVAKLEELHDRPSRYPPNPGGPGTEEPS